MGKTQPKWWQHPLFWLLAATFLKGVVWSGIVPLWHFPDEQAHFAQLQNLAEGNRDFRQGTTSREIVETERLLGTLRDEWGRNRFTFHPEYRLNYPSGFTGEVELKLKHQRSQERQELVIREATTYPPFYYLLGSSGYWLAYQGNIFDRVFAARFISVLLTVAMVWCAYKVGEIVWQNRLGAITLGILVSFQPMFTFVGAGVNSDVLLNFFFSLFIWASLRVFEKVEWRRLGILTASLVGGILAKQQMVIAIGLATVPLVYSAWHLRRRSKFSKHKLAVSFGIVALASFLTYRLGGVHRIWTFIGAGKDETLADLSLLTHLQWTARHTVAEVLPWYWGVFKWLGVVLPRWVNRIQMRLLLVSGLGLAVWLVKRLRSKQMSQKDWYVIWLGVVAGAYFGAVTLWDWQFRRAYGFSFGIQGRYFFPVIVAHMGLIVVGIKSLVPQKFGKWLLAAINGWWLVLSGVGLVTVLSAYYDLWPLQKLWWQVSQYKPFWFKAGWWFVWVGLFGTAITGLVISFFRELRSQKQA